MKEVIKDILNKYNIEEIGFAEIKYFKDLEKILIKQKKLNFDTPFQTGTIDEKTFKNEKLFKSAIVCLIPYQKPTIDVKRNEVYVSSSSWGNDYHKIFKDILNHVKEYLDTLGYKSKVCVDNNNLDERYLAYKAGLGFYGLNNLLINDRYGSYFFIGVILTDAIFKYDKPLNKTCNQCMKCIKACPTGALSYKNILNGNKCLSYITQKKEITEEEKKLLNQCIYGCDICSVVCPHNKNIQKNSNFKMDSNIIINVSTYSKLSNKEFKKKYGKYAFAWRGKKVFERNIEAYKEKIEKK